MSSIARLTRVGAALCVLLLAQGAAAQGTAHAGHAPAVSNTALAAAASPVLRAAHAAVGIKAVVLHTHIVDGRMVYVDDKGQVNPTIDARVGDTLDVELDSGEGAGHDS